MNFKKVVYLTLGLFVLPVMAFAAGGAPLIDNPNQIKDGILEKKLAPTLTAIATATATLRTDLTTETTTRIAADAAISATVAAQTVRLNALDVSTAAITAVNVAQDAHLAALDVTTGAFTTAFSSVAARFVQIAIDTTTIGGLINDAGAVNGLVKSDGSNNFSAAVPGVDYSTEPLTLPYTSTDGTLDIGTLDAYSRHQIHYSGVDSVLRLGSDAADGDAVNADSEGIVIYDVNPSSFMARIKADRFGLTDSATAGNYYFRADSTEMFIKDSTLTNKILDVTRASSLVAVKGGLQYQDTGATYGAGKFLTSDASGNATWATVPAGGDAFLANNQTFTGINTFTSSMTVNDELGLFTSFPQVHVDDVIGSTAAGGVMIAGGITGFANVIANNMYFNGGNWYRSKAGGGSLLLTDTTNGANGGDFQISRSTAGPADSLIGGSTLAPILAYKASTGRVGILNNAPTKELDVTGSMNVSVNVYMGRNRVVNACGAGASCTATCGASTYALGGSCSASPQISPLDGTLNDASYACNAGGAGSAITAIVVCARMQ